MDRYITLVGSRNVCFKVLFSAKDENVGEDDIESCLSDLASDGQRDELRPAEKDIRMIILKEGK